MENTLARSSDVGATIMASGGSVVLELKHICMDGPKSDGENPKEMAVTSGQTLRVEPLSSRTDGTLRPEQATSMNKGRTWYDPSGGKSSSKNTMHVTLSAVRKWISPSGVVAVSTLI